MAFLLPILEGYDPSCNIFLLISHITGPEYLSSRGSPHYYFLNQQSKVPNIPLLTGFHKIRGTFDGLFSTGGIAVNLLTKTGRGVEALR